MTIRPIRDLVLIRRDNPAEKSPGGIIIPETSKEKQVDRGVVVATGPGAVVDGKRREPEIKKGDHVLFGRYAGTEVDVTGEKLLLMKEGDVQAVLE